MTHTSDGQVQAPRPCKYYLGGARVISVQCMHICQATMPLISGQCAHTAHPYLSMDSTDIYQSKQSMLHEFVPFEGCCCKITARTCRFAKYQLPTPT